MRSPPGRLGALPLPRAPLSPLSPSAAHYSSSSSSSSLHAPTWLDGTLRYWRLLLRRAAFQLRPPPGARGAAAVPPLAVYAGGAA